MRHYGVPGGDIPERAHTTAIAEVEACQLCERLRRMVPRGDLDTALGGWLSDPRWNRLSTNEKDLSQTYKPSPEILRGCSPDELRASFS
jgi:hypothetical protein